MLVRRFAAARHKLGRLAIIGRSIAHGGAGTLSAAAVAWRPHLSASALLVGAALAARRRPVAAGALLGAGLFGAAGVAGRAVRRAGPPPAPGDVVVVTANVLNGRGDTGALAAAIARDTPHFVVLPEAGTDFRDKLMPLLHGLGYRSWVSTGPDGPDGPSVVLLVAERAGDVEVRRGTGMRLRHLEASGGILGSRRFFAVHTTAPTGRGRTAWWRAELDLIGRWCRAEQAPIVAGDLNATFDHPELRSAAGGCRSAAADTGRGLVGTYPAALPRWSGIQIDHVLVPAGSVTTRFAVLDIPGTDHRAVLARFRLPRPCHEGGPGSTS
jgi:endonuclease/exonuclease/phosphatase (EEP) superfamily protein YafD